MRGKVAQQSVSTIQQGITPAYAGKRADPRPRACRWGDHPRVCGEKRICREDLVAVDGSPPRMRGKGCFSRREHRASGITPAYAGKRHPVKRGDGPEGDHPRVCGEKDILGAGQRAGAGSPPRMRGKDPCRVADYRQGWITPAYAGKRILPGAHIPAVWDHPRVCGEKFSGLFVDSQFVGSPPRMRGKARYGTNGSGMKRITPAYAGKS